MKSSCKKLSPSHRYGHCAISLHELTSNSLEPEVLMLWGRDEKYELNDAWMLRKNQDEEYQWIEVYAYIFRAVTTMRHWRHLPSIGFL